MNRKKGDAGNIPFHFFALSLFVRGKINLNYSLKSEQIYEKKTLFMDFGIS